MLYLVGLGLDWGDLSFKALEIINQSDIIYLEGYTSVSNWSVEKLSRLIGKKIQTLDRKQTEEVMPFLDEAKTKKVVLLVHGDPLSATTHMEILSEAEKRKIKAEVIHSNSILTAVGETGLSLYKFGKTASIPLPEKDFKPTSFYDVLKENLSINAHTLFLLDLKPEEKKFITIPLAIKTLLSIAESRKEDLFTEETFCIGCARLGTKAKKIKAGSAKQLIKETWGEPPYCLIVPAKLNFKEEEYVRGMHVN